MDYFHYILCNNDIFHLHLLKHYNKFHKNHNIYNIHFLLKNVLLNFYSNQILYHVYKIFYKIFFRYYIQYINVPSQHIQDKLGISHQSNSIQFYSHYLYNFHICILYSNYLNINTVYYFHHKYRSLYYFHLFLSGSMLHNHCDIYLLYLIQYHLENTLVVSYQYNHFDHNYNI